MARSRALLLAAVLLLFLLAAADAAAAHQLGNEAEARGWQPEALASVVALFCAERPPTATRCETGVRSARVLGGVGGCLSRFAAEPPLVTAARNATLHQRLYARFAASSSVCGFY